VGTISNEMVFEIDVSILKFEFFSKKCFFRFSFNDQFNRLATLTAIPRICLIIIIQERTDNFVPR